MVEVSVVTHSLAREGSALDYRLGGYGSQVTEGSQSPSTRYFFRVVTVFVVVVTDLDGSRSKPVITRFRVLVRTSGALVSRIPVVWREGSRH